MKQQELEENSGHRKKRKSSALNVKETESDEKAEKNNKEVNNKVKEDKDEKPKVKKKSLPPPMGFAELLKLAEKKQHEPVVIEIKPKVENERPMTKRQKIEYIQEKERKEQREKKNSEKKDSQKKDSEKKDSEKKDSEKKDLEANKKTNVTSASSKLDKTQLNKVPKTNEKSVIVNSMPNKSTCKVATTISKQITDKLDDKHNIEKSNSSKSSSKNELLEERKKLEAERRQLEEMRRAIEEEKRKLIQSKNKLEDIKSQPSNKLNVTKPTKSINKQTLSKDIKSRQFPPSDLKLQSSLANIKPKQFPPSDVRPMKSKTVVKKASNKSEFTNKFINYTILSRILLRIWHLITWNIFNFAGRIYDDEEDESDLSDFIDDGPGDNEEDYSKHISEIFGYDKNKYKNIDEDEEEDIVMESNFAQQLKEEYISSKIGIYLYNKYFIKFV